MAKLERQLEFALRRVNRDRDRDSETTHEETSKIIQEKVDFKWLYENKGWLDYSENQLKELVGFIAVELNIPPEEAQNITIHFWDTINVIQNGVGSLRYAAMSPDVDDDGNFNRFRILISRYLFLSGCGQDNERAANYLEENKIYVISHLELLIWIFTEELSHANYCFTCKNEAVYLQKQEEYSKIASHKIIIQGEYDTSHIEMVGIKDVLTMLYKILQPLTPDRAKYFHDKLEKLRLTDQHLSLSLKRLRPVETFKWKLKKPTLSDKIKSHWVKKLIPVKL